MARKRRIALDPAGSKYDNFSIFDCGCQALCCPTSPTPLSSPCPACVRLSTRCARFGRETPFFMKHRGPPKSSRAAPVKPNPESGQERRCSRNERDFFGHVGREIELLSKVASTHGIARFNGGRTYAAIRRIFPALERSESGNASSPPRGEVNTAPTRPNDWPAYDAGAPCLNPGQERASARWSFRFSYPR